ncbi:MAG TPA: hypothetical protein DD435_03360 [Cyanobacteria bacterium UBA8530]|nr:hypothetical protein [Cyanobacteria bacterium UBA8530]
MADAFFHGRLNVLDHPSWLNELVPFQGKFFVVYPPMPAVILMPFMLLWGKGMNQALVSVILGALSVYLIYFLLYNLGFSLIKRIFFSLFFAFGTIFWYSAQNGTSWHFAQICATTFMLFAILESQEGKRPWLMGFYLGCAALSRLPTLLAFPFFLFVLFQEKKKNKENNENIALLIAWLQFGAVLSLFMGLYLLYNFLRFGSAFNTGYSLIPGLMQEYQYRYGFMSIHSIGRNLYALFLKSPNFVESLPYLQASKLGGLSILLTTPLFLWAIRARGRDALTLGCWLAVALISVPILIHSDPGGEQFGYRYAQDFYPFLFLLTMQSLKGRISFEQGVAIGLGLLVNAWGMWSTLTNFWG